MSEDGKNIDELDGILGSAVADGDLFLLKDVSVGQEKKITRGELRKALEVPAEGGGGDVAIEDVAGLQDALDAKADAADLGTAAAEDVAAFAAAVHTHAIGDVTGLQTALDGKAATSHTHAIADTTGLQAALDGKQASNANLTALAGQTGAADRVSYWTAAATLALAVLTSFGRTLIACVDAVAARLALGLGTAATLDADTDGTFAANSDTRLPTQKAAKTYIDGIIAAANAAVYKGAIDCSANPNYPAADAGWLYRVSVAGKIGGGSGVNVEVGDMLICLSDSTASGNHAGVGASWNVIQTNIDGQVIGPSSAVDGTVVVFDGTTGKLIKGSRLVQAGASPLYTIKSPSYDGTHVGTVLRYERGTGDGVNFLLDDVNGFTLNATYLQVYLAIVSGSVTFGDGNTQLQKFGDAWLGVTDVSNNPGKLTIGQLYMPPTALTYAATTNIDMAGGQARLLSLTGDVTFTISNIAAGRSVTVFLTCDATPRNIGSFPAGVRFVGAAAPTGIAASKVAVLTLTCTTGFASGIRAAYSEEP